ncbi:hypothetical protein [Pseudoalteromonas shioyasakiensis]|uniref:hypothetical protein n=1 Tax=Pseudoalteromonas shioyasakiensis TaxID=1190813 RepID=UPI001C3D71B7|nr:hypothetical protein [Pseudoalteromonas shioyasakiensis]
MLKTVLKLTPATCLLLSTSTLATPSIEQIKKRAAEINELKALIQSPDPSLRLAAIDAMQNSEDLAMREIAFAAGINASDESVVAVTIRNRISEIDNFAVLLTKPEGNDEAMKTYNNYGSKVMFRIRSYDKAKGTFVNDTHYDGSDKTSTISGLNLFLESSRCQGDFKLAEDLSYKGAITCSGAQFPAVINLF